jgi:hypothetical protein
VAITGLRGPDGPMRRKHTGQLTGGTRRESDSVRTLDGYQDALWPA